MATWNEVNKRVGGKTDRRESSSGLTWDSVNATAISSMEREKQDIFQQKLDFTNQQTETAVQDFEKTQKFQPTFKDGGWAGALNKFLGGGQSKPVLVGETPEYTQEREESKPKPFGDNFLKATEDITFGLSSQLQDFTEMADYWAGGKKQIGKQSEQYAKTQSEISKYLQEENLSSEAKQNLLSISKNIPKPKSQYKFAEKSNLQIAGQAAGTIADILTGGRGGLLFKGALKEAGVMTVKDFVKYATTKEGAKIIGKFLGKESVYGAGQFALGGAGEAAQEDKDLKGIAKQSKDTAIIGAVAQPAFSTVLIGLGKIYSKLGKKGPKLKKAITEKAITEKEVEDIFKDKGITGVNKKIDELEKVVKVEPKKGVLQVAKEEKVSKEVKPIEKEITKAQSEDKSFDEFVAKKFDTKLQDSFSVRVGKETGRRTEFTVNAKNIKEAKETALQSHIKDMRERGIVTESLNEGDVVILSKPKNGAELNNFKITNLEKTIQRIKTREQTDFTKKILASNEKELGRLKKQGEEKSQLKQLWEGGKKVEKPTPKPTPKVEAKVPTKTSKIAEPVKSPSPHATKIREGLIEKGIAKDMKGIAEYTPTTIKEQAKIMSPLLKDKERFKRVLRGGEDLPQGAKPGAVKTAVDLANDPELMRLYTNSEYAGIVSENASNMGIMQKNNPDSAVNKMLDVKKARKEKVMKPREKFVSRKLKEAIKLDVSFEKLDSFIKEITC